MRGVATYRSRTRCSVRGLWISPSMSGGSTRSTRSGTSPPFARLLRRFAAFSRVSSSTSGARPVRSRPAERPPIARAMDGRSAGRSRDSKIERVGHRRRQRRRAHADALRRTYPGARHGAGARRCLCDARQPTSIISFGVAEPRDPARLESFARLGPRLPPRTGWRRASRTSQASARSGLAMSELREPGAVMAMMKMVYAIDIRDLLPMIRVPTLVISRARRHPIRPQAGRYLADHIPDARFVRGPRRRQLHVGRRAGADRR